MIPLIITLIIWTLFNTFLSVTAVFVGITHGYVALGIKPIHKGGDTE